MRLLNEKKIVIEECPVSPERLAKMLSLIDDGTISGKLQRQCSTRWRRAERPETIVEEKDFGRSRTRAQLKVL